MTHWGIGEFGHFALCLAWILSIVGVIGGALGGARRSDGWFALSLQSTVLCAMCAGLSLLALGWMFVTNDYSNQYVWQYSNREMETIYKITAIWGGMDGSMLLWAGMLTFCTALLALQARHHERQLMSWVIAVANTSTLFFLHIVVFETNPFRYVQSSFIPPDGNGLNPLLQNPYMAIHPPMLYAGFTAFAIPFAFCIGALLSGRLSNEWLRLSRRWTLIAWGFLTAGIVLGGHWAYLELGWGGFWAWDPVENASFLPWLTGTAFLHSVMVQERKNMLRFWNVWLIVLTYGLTVFGTFLTRSGVVQSVHAFASTDIGEVFLQYLAAVFIVTAGLTWYRRLELRSERSLESLFSREAAFLLNNLVLLGIMFATLWGVMFPVLSEALTGQKQAVGIPFFNAVNVPIFLFLIFLMGVGPLIAWKRASWSSLRRAFLMPAVGGFLAGCALLWGGVTGFYPVLSYSLCAFVTLTILAELHRGIKAQRGAGGEVEPLPHSITRLFRRHTTRYGGYLIHLGVVVMTIGITASMAHKVEREFTLAQGATYEIGRYAITLTSLEEVNMRNYIALRARAEVRVRGSEQPYATLLPELRMYRRNQENTTEVALNMSLREDLYLILSGISDDNRAVFKVYINPLQVWLWIGTLVMLLGTAIVLLPRAGTLVARRVPVKAKEQEVEI